MNEPTITGQPRLRKEIEKAIGRCSAESGSDTPDFVLAQFLTDCLKAFDVATLARDHWYGDRAPLLPMTHVDVVAGQAPAEDERVGVPA